MSMLTQPWFSKYNGVLHAEDVPMTELAKKYGTPLYVYSLAALKQAWQSYEQPLSGQSHLICYGVKANSNLAILSQLQHMGAGFDIVSGGELERVLAAGAQANKVVFSGVGKQEWEIRAALAAGILCFNVESTAELELISSIAQQMGKRAPISLRVNPDVDAQTHPYISTGLKENKFGIDINLALNIYLQARANPNLDIVGIDCHIGSQICSIEPYIDALNKLIDLIIQLARNSIALAHVDLGGGLAIRYQDESPPKPAALLQAIMLTLRERSLGHLRIILEPGRSIIGNAGILLTQVQYLKRTAARNFAIVDAAMNDLMRPALYQAWHNVRAVQDNELAAETWDVVGPICETGDWLARGRTLAIAQQDLLAVESAGAYAFSMASQYNSRPRAAEVLVSSARSWLIRERESIKSLYELERIPEID